LRTATQAIRRLASRAGAQRVRYDRDETIVFALSICRIFKRNQMCDAAATGEQGLPIEDPILPEPRADKPIVAVGAIGHPLVWTGRRCARVDSRGDRPAKDRDPRLTVLGVKIVTADAGLIPDRLGTPACGNVRRGSEARFGVTSQPLRLHGLEGQQE
jgi:hypothetical protein